MGNWDQEDNVPKTTDLEEGGIISNAVTTGALVTLFLILPAIAPDRLLSKMYGFFSYWDWHFWNSNSLERLWRVWSFAQVAAMVFSAFGLIYIYKTYKAQREELELMREEVKATKEEIVLTRQEYERQWNYLANQEFESRFFKLLEHFTELRSGIKFWTWRDREYTWVQALWEIRNYLAGFLADWSIKITFASIEISWDMISTRSWYTKHYSIHSNTLHYFNYIFSILSYIWYSELSSLSKQQYISYLRELLTQQELLLIYYHSLLELHDPQSKKHILEQSWFFFYLDKSKLIDPLHEQRYFTDAFTQSTIS